MDTADLTNAEVGAYMRLLCFQWEHGAIPKSLQKRARIVCESNRKTSALWCELSRFFEEKDGAFLNPRMEQERLKQAKRREALVEAGRKGGLSNAASQASSQASSKTQASLNPSSSIREIEEDISLSTEELQPASAREVQW